MRATVSVSRTQACRRSAQPLISRSPAAWPRRSLTSLKRSRSTQTTAATSPRRLTVATACSKRSPNSSRLGRLGQGIVQSQILRAPLGLDLGRDVGRGPAPAAVAALVIAHRLAGDPQRARPAAVVLAQAEQIAERPPLPKIVLMALPAFDALGGMQQVAERFAEHQVRRDAGHGGKTLRQEAQPQIGIGLPNPVRAGIGHVAKADLAGLDGLGRLARVTQHDAR